MGEGRSLLSPWDEQQTRQAPWSVVFEESEGRERNRVVERRRSGGCWERTEKGSCERVPLQRRDGSLVEWGW